MKLIVFVPGIMGSRLHLQDGTEVWPPTVGEVLFTGYKRTADLVRPDLHVGDVIDRVCVDFYGPILGHLGATANAIGGQLIPHPYDWRRDLTELGTKLGARLDELALQHGDAADITLVCHSMGGLVARSWLERPIQAMSPGLKATRLAVFLAVPHEGAPLAFARAIGVGGGSVGMSAADQRQLSRAPGLPAAYQLFPPAALQPIWKLDSAVPFEGMSLFDPSLVPSLGLSASHLATSEAFAAGLDPKRKPVGCRYFAVASSTHSTMTRFTIQAGNVSPVTVEGSGDGTVPVRSATALPVQTAYVDADHVGVTQHANTHTILSMLLGAQKPGAVAAFMGTEEPTVSVSPKFATVGEDYEIVVLPGHAAPFAGVIEIRAEQPNGSWQLEQTITVIAASPGVRTITITGPALPPGRYGVRLIKDSSDLAGTEFVMMQRPAV